MTKNYTKYAFIILEILIWFLILFLEPSTFTKIICFISVLLAFIYSIIFSKNTYKIISIGLFFTMCADFCLSILDPIKQLPSMFFFSFAQLSYFIYLMLKQKKKLQTIHLITRLTTIVIALLITIIVLKDKTDFLSLITLFYFANLIMNLVFSSLDYKNNILLIIGFIFFILCDIQVGLGVANTVYFDLNKDSLIYKIITVDINLIWLCYIPSQTLISLHSTKEKN